MFIFVGIKSMRVVSILFLSIISSTLSIAQEKTTARQIINNMISAINNMQTITYDLDLSERINGKMTDAKSRVKLNVNPRKIYVYIPKMGAELLWISNTNSGDALVNPNAFPFINLNLDPVGGLLRSGQHHTLHELGFSYFSKIIAGYVSKAGNNFDEFFSYLGDVTWDNRECYKIYIENPDFKYFTYTPQKGENLILIARKFNVSEHMLMEKNGLKDYGTVKEGRQIIVPNSYAQKTILYIDKQNYLPIYQKIYDEKGLYESYEYHNVKYNTVISPEEFTKEYKGYNF